MGDLRSGLSNNNPLRILLTEELNLIAGELLDELALPESGSILIRVDCLMDCY